jgi:hypothetical protein
MTADHFPPFSSAEGTLQSVLAPASRPSLQIYQALLVFMISLGLVVVFVSSDIREEAPVIIDGSSRQILTAPVDGILSHLSGEYRCVPGTPVVTIDNPRLESDLQDAKDQVSADRAAFQDWQALLLPPWTGFVHGAGEPALKTTEADASFHLLEARLAVAPTVSDPVLVYGARDDWSHRLDVARKSLDRDQAQVATLQDQVRSSTLQTEIAGHLVWRADIHAGAHVRAGQVLGDVDSLFSSRVTATVSWDRARELRDLGQCLIFQTHSVEKGVPARIIGLTAEPAGLVDVEMEASRPLSRGNVYVASFNVGRQPLWRVLFMDTTPVIKRS